MTTPKHRRHEAPKLKAHNPLYPFTRQLNFDDFYRPIYSHKFLLCDYNQQRKYTRQIKQKKCCICGRREPEVTFKQKSHVIPASFGNRWLFSAEECDECNRQYGKKYENDLAAMFSGQRILGRIPKRKSHPKIRIPDKKSFMEINKNNIAISIEDNEHDFGFKQLNDNTLSLTVPVPPYYPVNAIKSIAHTLWLVLDKKRRTKYGDILGWINNETEISAVNYIEGLNPGPGDGILSFLVWEKIKEHEDLTNMIVKFHFSNTFIVWELPDFRNNRYVPGILPEFDISIFYPYEPKLLIKSIQSNKQMRPKKMNFTMSYESKEEYIGNSRPKSYFDIAELGKRKIEKAYNAYYKQPFPVRLTAIKDNEKIVIDHSYLVFKDVSEKYLKFSISGGHLAGSIEMTSFKNKRVDLIIKSDFKVLSPSLAKNSFQFFKAINSGCDLAIKDLITETEHINRIQPPGGILNEDICVVLESLEIINNEFKTDIRFSSDFTKKELQDICYLANGIKYGKFESETEKFQIRIKITDLNNVTKFFKRKSNSIYIRQKGTFVIRDVTMEAGDFKIIAVNPKLKGTTYINEEYVDINITADSIIFNFEKYVEKIKEVV